MVELDKQIILKAQAGDGSAFEAIYRAYFGFVSNVAYRVIGNVQDAQEITQDVFMRIYHHLKDFRFESSLKTWVYRITVNGAINYAKKTNKQRNSCEYIEGVSAYSPAQVETVAEEEFNENLIKKLLEVLNPEQRAVITLRSFEGLSYEQIAQTLGIPINTVRSRLKRAREAMLAVKQEVVGNDM